MATKAQENKNNLINAANVVSVTATLVAMASFVGAFATTCGIIG